MSIKEDIVEVTNSFRSYDKMYDDLLEFGVESLYHPLELEWMLNVTLSFVINVVRISLIVISLYINYYI